LCVMGLFGCTHKTISVGVPLINAMYEGNPLNVGLYTLPLLIWHPMQLLVGSILAPRLKAYVERERLRLTTTARQQQSQVTVDDNGPALDEQSPLVPSGSSTTTTHNNNNNKTSYV
jgi:solute carrier family 10 (sodium/bile acid cotransporter), member 7